MSRHSHVVVGYDGSRAGDQIVRWAVTEAKLRRIGVTVCHAWQWERPMTKLYPGWPATVERMAEHVLDHGVFIARTSAPTVPVRKALLPGPPSSALLHLADDAELIVVGSHGGGELHWGSIAVRTAARASCPVVVIRGVEPADRRIIVGVDGSAASDAALAFAFEEAALKGWYLHAVHCFGDPDRPPEIDPEILRQRAGVMLERAVAPWRDKYPQVSAWTHLVPEPPRGALTEAAVGAEMLVVGDHGNGGPSPLTLGAVSRELLLHAPCSVTVAHPLWFSGGEEHHDRAGRARGEPARPARFDRMSPGRGVGPSRGAGRRRPS
ncbi:universal stress protein [Actinomadura alba]|uniref:Universal stress protein n=1 Tax=Actinomadura alba TaxID=406431 RepID=A0ABR7LYD2_9ACTN|nr:universal stress protein [Actinomadura alba]MBC6469766.1 universal stress protein [Actinomadura alba]